MGGTIAGQKQTEGLAGDISLGLDNDGLFQYTRTERATSELNQDLSRLEHLESIDRSLKTLLDYMEIITGDKLGQD